MVDRYHFRCGLCLKKKKEKREKAVRAVSYYTLLTVKSNGSQFQGLVADEMRTSCATISVGRFDPPETCYAHSHLTKFGLNPCLLSPHLFLFFASCDSPGMSQGKSFLLFDLLESCFLSPAHEVISFGLIPRDCLGQLLSKRRSSPFARFRFTLFLLQQPYRFLRSHLFFFRSLFFSLELVPDL